MFNIKELKEKHKKELEEKKKKIKSLKQLNGYLNTFDYKEFMPLNIPKDKDETTFLIKPLPFVDNNNVSGLCIYFSKHLSKDNKYNCRLNIYERCEICESSTIKKFDFVIFPAFILKNNNNDFYKKKIFLIEVSLEYWENYIENYIEDFYNKDLVLNIHIKKDKNNYIYRFNNDNFKIKELTEEEILNKSFSYEKIKSYLYNEKAYKDKFNINLKKDFILKEKEE